METESPGWFTQMGLLPSVNLTHTRTHTHSKRTSTRNQQHVGVQTESRIKKASGFQPVPPSSSFCGVMCMCVCVFV